MNRPEQPPPTHSPDERAAMLALMQETSNFFYSRAVRIGCHPFIEFTGLLNEFIKVCHRAHLAGIDFNECTAHSGRPLPIEPHEAAYLGEKLGCIYGPSLQAPANREAFMRAAGIQTTAACPECNP